MKRSVFKFLIPFLLCIQGVHQVLVVLSCPMKSFSFNQKSYRFCFMFTFSPLYPFSPGAPGDPGVLKHSPLFPRSPGKPGLPVSPLGP